MEKVLMSYGLIADLLVSVHLVWVLVIVLMVPLIIIGKFKGWNWVRKPWIRITHVTMILIVVGESWLSIPCPLTVWEKKAQKLAGLENYEGSFIGNLFQNLLYYSLPSWLFTAAYTCFGLLIIALFLWIPIRTKK